MAGVTLDKGRLFVVALILAGAIAGGTSILWAALGETISERAGVINVGTSYDGRHEQCDDGVDSLIAEEQWQCLCVGRRYG